MDVWYGLVIVGLICGAFSALFGVGAGIIMVPLLALVAGFPQKSAQGMSLAVMVPMALVGAIRYKMNPEINMDMVRVVWLALGAVVGAWLGAYAVSKVSGVLLRRVFAVVMVVAAVRMFMSPARSGGKPAPASVEAHSSEESHEDKAQ